MSNTGKMNLGIAGRVIMITGGGSGIGRETALHAVAQGARVAICDADRGSVDQVCGEIVAKGGSAHGLVFDVRDGAATNAAVDEAERELGPIAGLVASAGISRPQLAEAISLETWNAVVGVNLTGVFLSCQAVGRRMIERRAGSIVAIASGDAMGGHSGRAHYCASKYGVVGLVKTLAIEWGRHGIRVNATAPGAVDTPMLRRGVPAGFIDSVMIDRTPMTRLADAADQARASLFLLSDAAGFINGALLPVDGGATAGYLTHRNGADYCSSALAAAGAYEP